MASKRLATGENEGYESVKVQIDVAGANLNSTKSTGKVFKLNGHEYLVSRFGSWALHEVRDDSEVTAILADGGIVVAITWAFSRAYPEVTMWVNDVGNSQFTLDVKRSRKKMILGEIGNGTMARKLEKCFRSVHSVAAFKELKIKCVKVIDTDEVPTKKGKKNADTKQRFSEQARLDRLLNSEKVASMMKKEEYSWSFVALKTYLQTEKDELARLQMLIRLLICALHLENDREVELVFPQMLRLLKTVNIPKEEVFFHLKDYRQLLAMLLLDESAVLAIELSLPFVKIVKTISNATDRVEKIASILNNICMAIKVLLTNDPSACLKSAVLRHFEMIKSELELVGKETECDSMVRAQSIYYVEFNICQAKAMLEMQTQSIFRDSTMEFKRISSCWADLPFVITRLRLHPETSQYIREPEFVGDMGKICNDPSLLEEKIKDPKIARANEVLMSNFAMFSSPMDIIRTFDKAFIANDLSNGDARASPAEPEYQKTLEKPMDEKLEAQKEKVKGNRAYKAGQFEKALSHYDKAIVLDSTDALLHSNKAAVYISQNRLAEAKSSCLMALGMTQTGDRHDDKDVAKVIARLARVESLAGKPHVAVPIYRRSLRLDFDAKVQEQMKECEEMTTATTFFYEYPM